MTSSITEFCNVHLFIDSDCGVRLTNLNSIGQWLIPLKDISITHSTLGAIVEVAIKRSIPEKLPLIGLCSVGLPLLGSIRSELSRSSMILPRLSVYEEPQNILRLLKSPTITNVWVVVLLFAISLVG